MPDGSKTPRYPILDDIKVPDKELENWQVTIDLLAEIAGIPAALIKRVHAREIEVLLSSNSTGNIYHPGERMSLDSDLYCEAVMISRKRLLVPNALKDPAWDHNPDIALGMISYCGLPLTWPGGEIFGVISILDNKENSFNHRVIPLMERFRDSIQFSLENIYNASVKLQQADKELRDIKELFSIFMQHSPIYVYIKEVAPSESRVLYASDNFHEMIGIPAPDMTGKTMAELYPPEFAAKITADDWAVVSGDEVQKLEETLNGRTYTTIKFPLALGKKTLLAGYTIDITERKRNEAINASRLHLIQFSATHSLDEILEETVNEAEKLTCSLIGFYHFVEADQKSLSLQNWSTRTKAEFCKAEGKGVHYDVAAAGVWVDCVYQRKPVIHNDYASLPHRKGMPEGHATVVRELVAPVIRAEKITAILGVGNKPADYNQQDVEAISLLADLAWEIAERKRAEEELTKHRDHLEELVKERTAEIEQKNADLERMNRLFVGRELRMVELKERIRELEGKAIPEG